MDYSVGENEPYVLVEGPMWGDAEFYGKWLLAAAQANALWNEAIKDFSFAKQVDRLMVVSIPEFGIGATSMLSKLAKNFNSFAIQLHGEEVELYFVMMVEMGFFALTGQRYQMVIPAQLNMDAVKSAALKFAQTEDEECFLHAEHLIASMPYTQAKKWQTRLCQMDEDHRCADRVLLLEVTSPR